MHFANLRPSLIKNKLIYFPALILTAGLLGAFLIQRANHGPVIEEVQSKAYLPSFMQEICHVNGTVRYSFSLFAESEIKIAAGGLFPKPDLGPESQTTRSEIRGVLSIQKERASSVEARLKQNSGTSRFSFNLDSRCRISGLSFPASMPNQERVALNGLIQELQFIVPAGSSVSEWDSHESDAIGTFVSHYRVKKNLGEQCQLEKKKLRYEAIEQVGQALHAEILQSESEADFSKGVFWLTRGSKSERIKLLSDNRVFVEAHMQVEIQKLNEFSWPEVPELDLTPYTEMSPDRHTQKDADQKTAAELELQFAQTAWGDALREYEETLKTEITGSKKKAVDFLSDYLKYQPERAFDLVATIRNRSIAGDGEVLSFLALQLSGTPESERALAQIVGDSGFSSMNRMRAAIAFQNLSAPSKVAVDALASQMASLPYLKAGAEYQVAQTATLSLGSTVNTLRNSDPFLAEEVETRLARELVSTSVPETIAILLESIGNTHSPGFEGTVVEYLGNDSESVRAASASALGKIEGTGREGALFQQLTRETSPRVKREIYGSLSALPRINSETLKFTSSSLADETHPDIRRLMVSLIGPYAQNDSRVQEALASAFIREADRGNLEEIGKFMAK